MRSQDEIAVQILIALKVDPEQARRGVAALKDVSAGLQATSDSAEKAESRFERIAQQASNATRQFTQMAATAAKVTAALAGTAITSTAGYGQKFAGVEGDATRVVAAQKALSDAFTDLGRVTSRIVTPVLEVLADVISVATQALDKLIPKGEGNPLEKFIKDAIPNAIQTLVQLTDIVKILGKQLEGTFDSIATDIRKFINTLGDTFSHLGDVVGIRVEEIADRLATGFRVFGIDLKAFVNDLYNSIAESDIGKALGMSAVYYKKGSTPEDQKTKEKADFVARQVEREGRLKQFYGKSVEQNKIEDELLSFRQSIREKELQTLAADAAKHGDIANDIRKALKEAGEAREAANQITKEIIDAFSNMKKSIADANTRFKAESDKAEQTKKDADLKAEAEYREATAELDAEYMANEIKATREFRQQEEQIAQQSGKERIRILRDLESRLTDLAAARDVAGFIQAQREGQRQLDDQAEQADQASKERVAAFEAAREEDRANYQAQRADLQSNLDKQKALNKRAFDEQISALRSHRDEEIRSAKLHFAEVLANQVGVNKELEAIQQAHNDAMVAQMRTWVAANQAELNALFGSSKGMSNTQSQSAAMQGVVDEIARQPYNASYQRKQTAALNDVLKGLPRFHQGGVMRGDGLAWLRDKEEIRTPEQQASGGGRPINVTIYNTVGDVATQSMLDRMADYTIDRVATGLTNALVPGGSGG